MVAASKPEAGGSASDASSTVTNLMAEWQQMKSARQNWDIIWDQVARYISPRKGNILTKLTPGQEQTLNIYDTTADKANKVFAAGLVSHICPAGEKWFRFEPETTPGGQPNTALGDWCDQVGEIALNEILNSKFYETIHEDFLDAGQFCTSCLLLEEGKKFILNPINIPVGTFAIDENAEGTVDKVGREWKWSARQAMQKWGIERLGPQVRKALDSNRPADWNRQFTFVHMVKPREGVEVVNGFAMPTKRPWASFYLCQEDQHIIEEGGYYEMPYLVSRLLRSNNEVYGRGPGLDTLPDIKMVNAMRRDFLIMVEKLGQPGWVMADDSDYLPDNRPNGITYYTDPNRKPEQIQSKADLNWAKDEIKSTRDVIYDAFYNPMFQLLTNMEEQRREKTAYEVQQMVAEKLILFSPLFARMCNEKLGPFLERTVGILARNGKLPPLPVELQGEGRYKIVYTSKIALAIKAAENQSFATMIQLVTEINEFDPSVKHVAKWRDGFRRVIRNVGMPSALINDDKTVDKLTAQEQEAMQAQMQAQTAELATKSAANLGPGAQKLAVEKLQAQAQRP